MEKKIAEIRKEFEAASFSEIPALIEAYWEDERSGVRNLIGKYEKKLDALDKERERLEAMRQYEHEYEGQYELICGIDEAGRGPLAGPVVAGAVILPKDCEILGLNDSKKLSEKKREELYDEIMEKAVAAAVGIVGPARIDEINCPEHPGFFLTTPYGSRAVRFPRFRSSREMPRAFPSRQPVFWRK